jgi:DNA-directed RNA polymerase subunit RPC12/RpoP
MHRTDILCPECMKKKLLQDVEHPTELRCDECGTEFILKGTNQVVYK